MNNVKKYALVTGVSRAEGLGYEITKQLAEAGYTVYASARNLADAQTLADRAGEAGVNLRTLAAAPKPL